MGRIANKKTGELNKAYREHSVFYSPSRGRKRNPWRSTRRRRTLYSKPRNRMATTTSSIEPKGCLVSCLVVLLLIVAIVLACVSCSKIGKKEDSTITKEDSTITVEKIITLEELQSAAHPKVADHKDSIKEYYEGFKGVDFDHAAHIKSEKTSVLTWYYTSGGYDYTYNDIVIDFSKLSADEQRHLTFEKVLEIAISFVPVEDILEFYSFDRAIYVERENHIAHELYYKDIDEKTATRPNKFSGDHGFSLVIKEYNDGHFEVFIETNWYDFVYDTNPTVGKPTTEEELMAHQEWLFSLEGYMNR